MVMRKPNDSDSSNLAFQATHAVTDRCRVPVQVAEQTSGRDAPTMTLAHAPTYTTITFAATFTGKPANPSTLQQYTPLSLSRSNLLAGPAETVSSSLVN